LNDELEKAFECLRQKLCSPPVLSIPNIGKPYCVHTDASGFAVAAAIDRSVRCYRKKTAYCICQPKVVWSSTGMGLCHHLGIKPISEHLGSDITIFSDHNPLQYIRDCVPKSANLLRWALALQEFHVEVRYMKGSQNVVADYLSHV